MQQRHLAIDVNERESWRILQQLTLPRASLPLMFPHKVTNIDRRSLRLPAYPKELLEIDLQHLEIDYVLLSKMFLMLFHRRPLICGGKRTMIMASLWGQQDF